MARSTDPPKTLEVWMRITPERRRLLVTVLKQQHVSWREIAIVAGYRTHSFMQRVLRGEVNSLPPIRALRIAKHLGFDVDVFFLPESSITDRSTSTTNEPPRPRRKKSRRAA